MRPPVLPSDFTIHHVWNCSVSWKQEGDFKTPRRPRGDPDSRDNLGQGSGDESQNDDDNGKENVDCNGNGEGQRGQVLGKKRGGDQIDKQMSYSGSYFQVCNALPPHPSGTWNREPGTSFPYPLFELFVPECSPRHVLFSLHVRTRMMSHINLGHFASCFTGCKVGGDEFRLSLGFSLQRWRQLNSSFPFYVLNATRNLSFDQVSPKSFLQPNKRQRNISNTMWLKVRRGMPVL